MAYMVSGVGLGLDVVMFDNKGAMNPKIHKNMLRPETVESLFYMWRVTGDPKWREWGWNIFEAFQRYSRTPEGAYATVKVTQLLQIKTVTRSRLQWYERYRKAEKKSYMQCCVMCLLQIAKLRSKLCCAGCQCAPSRT